MRADGSVALRRGETPVHGSFFQQSSFSTFSLATERNVIKVPRDAPLDVLAAFPCGVNTGAGAVMNVLKPRPGDSFAVFGAGTVGLAGLMAARIAGCDPVIAVDVFENRLALARELGATHVVDARRADAAAEVRRIAGGAGVRFSLEAAGVPAALRTAVDALAPRGTCCLVGSARDGVEAALEMRTLQQGRIVRGCIQGESVVKEFLPRSSSSTALDGYRSTASCGTTISRRSTTRSPTCSRARRSRRCCGSAARERRRARRRA